MKLKYLLLLPLLLVSCNSNNNQLKTICPTGAPSLLFYDQGNNENVLFQSQSNLIIPQFQTKQYDAIVIDAINGLEQIRIHKDIPYRFSKLLTNGNLYLISYKYDVEPDSTKSLCAFGNEKSVPNLVTKKLNENWKIKEGDKLEFKNTVQDVLVVAKNNVESYDYFILAEPALTALINSNKDVKKIWSLKSILGSDIPQAALFINKDKKDQFKTYLNDLNLRIDNTINHPDVVKDELDKFSKDPSDIATKFGFASSSLVFNIQNGNGGSKTKNGFAIYDKDNKFDSNNINSFLDLINYDKSIRYDESYFINI